MSGHSGQRRQPDFYWKHLEQLKASSICIRLYRNKLHKRVTAIETWRALSSSGGIALWAVWKEYAFLWACIIAIAQVLDALKNVFPFTKMHKAASDLTVAMELIYIDAEDQWERIYLGKFTDEMIIDSRTRLRKLQLEAEQKHFPEGFEPSHALIELATEEASAYFEQTYSGEQHVLEQDRSDQSEGWEAG